MAKLVWSSLVVAVVGLSASCGRAEQPAPPKPPAAEQPGSSGVVPAAQTRDAAAAEGRAALEDERNTVDVYQLRAPSVVAINVAVRGRRVSPFEDIPLDELPDFLRDALPEQQEPVRGSGSGFVVDDKYHIVTNYHVVEPVLQPGKTDLVEGATLDVVFSMVEKPFPAKVVGATAIYDLALLELKGNLPDVVKNVKPIELANSEQIRVGQKTIAIGNPFGFASTVTTGIVSGIGRSLPGVGQVQIPLVQTDAAINPGNSGGPLLDSQGRLLGVNSAIIPGLGVGGTRGFVGLGFAVPSNLVRDSLPTLLAGGLTDITTRARLGISVYDLRQYPPEVRKSLSLPESGIALVSVQPRSPAEAAGLRGARFQVMAQGQTYPAGMDVILAIEGKKIRSTSELQQVVLSRDKGDSVKLTIWRDGKTLDVQVKLAVVAPPPEEDDDEDDDDGDDD